MEEREVWLSDRSMDCSEADGIGFVAPEVASGAAKTVEHLSAQDADFPHSPGLAQSCPCGQQSD